MEKTSAKFYLIMFFGTASAYVGSSLITNLQVGSLLDFGTIDFRQSLDPDMEKKTYAVIAEYSLFSMAAYPFMILSAIGFVRSTSLRLKQEGWLMMSAILLLMFIPVELYGFWLDWKVIGLQYWGDWPIEEFRKAMLTRITAMAGLPFIAQLCYFTIPIFIIFKPFRQHNTP